MWKLDFQISGLPATDGERGRKRNNDGARNAIWLIAGLIIAYLFLGGAKTDNGVAIVLPTNGSSTLEPQVLVVGKVTGGQAEPVTLRVNDTTQTVAVADDVFQTQVTLTVGRNDIRASSGGIESEPITIIRKPRPILRIDTPPSLSQTQELEIGVAGTVDYLEGDSIRLEVNGNPQDLRTSGGRFSTKVPLVIGANTIRAVAPGTEPELVTVIRSEPNKAVIAITSPENGTTTVMDSVTIRGTVVNSDAPEITLQRNLTRTKVPVRDGRFEFALNLDVGQNDLQALVGEARSEHIIVNRKLPPRIEIKLDTTVYDNYRFSTSIRPVKVVGAVENMETQSVSIRVNNAPRGNVAVSNGRFEYYLKANTSAFYRIQAYMGEYESNVLIINPSSPQAEPRIPTQKIPPQKKSSSVIKSVKGVKQP